MLHTYKCFIHGKFKRDPNDELTGEHFYVIDIFEDKYLLSTQYYDKLERLCNTELFKELFT